MGRSPNDREGKVINVKRARALAWAIVLTASAGGAQTAMAQQPGGGGGGGSMMGGGTNQYGVLEILGVAIGVAVLILLVVLVVRVSKK